MKHTFIIDRPSLVTATLGGAAGAVLFAAALFAAPAWGAAHVDLPRLVGGLVTGDPAGAFWVGFWLLFVVGWLVLPLAFSIGWGLLPGARLTFTGGALKGVVLGAGLWCLAGILLPLLAGLTRVDALPSPGFFALALGPGAALTLAAAALGYGVVATSIAVMGQGISPIDSTGWGNHGAGRAA